MADRFDFSAIVALASEIERRRPLASFNDNKCGEEAQMVMPEHEIVGEIIEDTKRRMPNGDLDLYAIVGVRDHKVSKDVIVECANRRLFSFGPHEAEWIVLVALSVLLDPQKREEYDRRQEASLPTSPRLQRPDGFSSWLTTSCCCWSWFGLWGCNLFKGSQSPQRKSSSPALQTGLTEEQPLNLPRCRRS